MSTSGSSRLHAVRDLLDRGLIQFALGHRDEAIALWQQALVAAPGDERAGDYLRSVGAIPTKGGVAPVRAAEAITDEVQPPKPAAAPRRPPFTDDMPAYKPGAVSQPLPEQDDDGDSVITDVEILLASAQEAEESGDLAQALGKVEELLKREPDHFEAGEQAAALRRRLADRYRSALEPLDAVPYLRATDASILELSLDPIGGFLISQIDGEITVEELLTILGTFDEFRVLSSLHFFLENGIIELKAERRKVR